MKDDRAVTFRASDDDVTIRHSYGRVYHKSVSAAWRNMLKESNTKDLVDGSEEGNEQVFQTSRGLGVPESTINWYKKQMENKRLEKKQWEQFLTWKNNNMGDNIPIQQVNVNPTITEPAKLSVNKTRKQAKQQEIDQNNLNVVNNAYARIETKIRADRGNRNLSNSSIGAIINDTVFVTFDAIIEHITEEAKKLGMPGFENSEDNDKEYESERARSKACHILNMAIESYNILCEVKDEQQQQGTLLKRPFLKRSFEITDIIRAQSSLKHKAHSDLDRASRNKNGLTKVNQFKDKSEIADHEYVKNTEKYCPIVLACSSAAVTKTYHQKMMEVKDDDNDLVAYFSNSSSQYRVVVYSRLQYQQQQQETSQEEDNTNNDSINEFKNKSALEISEILTNKQYNFSAIQILNNEPVRKFYGDWFFRMGKHKIDGQRTRNNNNKAIDIRSERERKTEAEFTKMMSSKPYAPYTIKEASKDFSGLRIGAPYPLLLPVLFVNNELQQQHEEIKQDQPINICTAPAPTPTLEPILVKMQKQQQQPFISNQFIPVGSSLGFELPYAYNGDPYAIIESDLAKLLDDANKDFQDSILKHNKHLLIHEPELLMNDEDKQRYFKQLAEVRDSTIIDENEETDSFDESKKKNESSSNNKGVSE